MSASFHDGHIATILDRGAATQAGITIYTSGEHSKPAHLSYSQLRALVTQKAQLLRGCKDVGPGKVLLIHFQTHLENIIWFWAAILAGCVPALSTPLVRNTQGRLTHFKHLHRLLLDPLVITSAELLSNDFAENDILQVLAVEDIERVRLPETVASAQSQASRSGKTYFSSNVSRPINGSAETVPNGMVDGDHRDPTESMNDGPSEGKLDPQINGHNDSATSSLEGVAVLMLTSGSTGSAKAVCLTHTQLHAAIAGKLFAMPLEHESALLNWIALDHVASLVEIHLCALCAGLDQVHVPATDILGDPMLFIRLLSLHHVSRTFAPNFFLQKLQTVLDNASVRDLEGVNLGSLCYIASGGEPNNVGICARVIEHLLKLGGRETNIIRPGFGMTETCAGAIFNRECPIVDIDAGREFASLGMCVPGIEMRISPVTHASVGSMGPNGCLDTEGALEIRGLIVFEKYFNNDEATRMAFTDDGWFKTGDLASVDSHGYLQLSGRSKDLININGVKYLPHELEAAIGQAGITGITESFVISFAHRPSGSSTEEIYVVYQHNYDATDSQARMETLHLIQHVVTLFTGARPRVLPLAPGRLEKSTLGKLSRAKIRVSLAQGQYQEEEALNDQIVQSFRRTHHSKPENETERTLLRIVISTLSLDNGQMGTNTLILDTGINSVDLIRLKRLSEKAFGIADIPMATILTNTTVRSLASAIGRTQSSRYEHEYSPVVTLQHKGAKTPLWLIHPGIGEILVFLGLVQYFPDRPIYGLRARGFNPGESPFDGLTDILTTYFNALKDQQPHGPYAIAGYSYGSMLAFELSKMLEAGGDVVQFLGSFNLPPHIKERMRMLDWTAGLLHIAHFCGIITEQRSEELVDELRELPQSDQVIKLLAESDQERCSDLALTRESLGTWIGVAWSLQNIGWEYEPSGSVECMDVFYCQPLKVVARTRQEYRETKLNRWTDFVRCEVRFHEVDGEHYTMIGSEHVFTFQQTLRKALVMRGL
ncbi:MAG: hypothetical protein LQ341_001750 [Variospora aurantia]|nr:MAG: hypothetical protein LQ341_001750 [Variospora aurantia]